MHVKHIAQIKILSQLHVCSNMTCCLTFYNVYYIVCINTDDLSKNKIATQSTTYKSLQDNNAGNAVDRNISTCMRTEVIGPTSPDQTVWWQVDLGGVYSIYSVNILFKNYPGYGMYQKYALIK